MEDFNEEDDPFQYLSDLLSLQPNPRNTSSSKGRSVTDGSAPPGSNGMINSNSNSGTVLTDPDNNNNNNKNIPEVEDGWTVIKKKEKKGNNYQYLYINIPQSSLPFIFVFFPSLVFL